MSSSYHNSFMAIVGATSLSEFVTHPFEFVKVKAQIKFSKSGVKPSRFEILTKFLQRDGVASLYRGFSPGILRAIQNQTIRLYLYGYINRILPQPSAQDAKSLWKQLPRKFLSALISSFFAGLAGNPWVVLKVRMIADKTGQYKNLFQAFRSIIRNDGYRELTKGTTMTIARGILISTLELTIYDTLKYALRSEERSNRTAYFISSVIASFVSAFFSYPFDVVITLYMNQSSQGDAKNRGLGQILEIARSIYSKSGMRGFYFGFSGFASRCMVYGPVFWNSLEFFNELSAKYMKF